MTTFNGRIFGTGLGLRYTLSVTLAMLGGCFPPALPQGDVEEFFETVEAVGGDLPSRPQDGDGGYQDLPSDLPEWPSEDVDPEPPQLAAPSGVVATMDRSEEVLVQWQPVVGATGYMIVRFSGSYSDFPEDHDGQLYISEWNDLLAHVGPTTLSYTDNHAAGPEPLGAPSLVASVEHTDGVHVSWSEVYPSLPRLYRYEVTAIDSLGRLGLPSMRAWGRRAPTPVLRYELSIDDGPWIDFGIDREWYDRDAGPGFITPPAIEASQGSYQEFVRLTRTQAAHVSAGPSRSYRVRAITAAEIGRSAQATGRRNVGTLYYRFERSIDETNTSYEAFPWPGAEVHDDFHAPPGGVVRYYRLRAEADGASTTWSLPSAGWRMPTP